MTTRTHTQFTAAVAIGQAVLFIADFHASENARHALRDAIGGQHEAAHCEHYSNTLSGGRRILGCFQRDALDAYAVRWVAGHGPDHFAGSAGFSAERVAADALNFFGGAFPITREQQISQVIVDSINDPDGATLNERFVALQETFDDTTLLVQRTLVTLTINDELPRMLRPNESIKFDAPATLNLTNFVTIETSGTLLNFAIPEGYQLAVHAVYNAYRTPNRNQPSPTPTEVTKPVVVNTDNNLIVGTLSAALNDTAPEARESRREFVGLRATITATPTTPSQTETE